MGKRFTEAERQKIIELGNEGKSYKYIATAMGCSEKRIFNWFYHESIKKEKASKPPLYAKRPSCQGCRYQGARGGCNFLLVNGYSRGCKAENCDKYEVGKKTRGIDPYINRNYKEDFKQLIYSQETV